MADMNVGVLSTGKRGRPKLTLDKAEFQTVVTQVETTHKPTTHSQLWKLIEATEWAKGQSTRPLTAQVAMMRAAELGIIVTTPKGKKGDFGGKRNPAKPGEVRARKRKGMTTENLDAYIAKIPPRALEGASGDKLYTILEKAEKGNIKAIIKAHCLACSNFQPSEIRRCQVESCALYSIRPYQGRPSADESISGAAVAEQS